MPRAAPWASRSSFSQAHSDEILPSTLSGRVCVCRADRANGPPHKENHSNSGSEAISRGSADRAASPRQARALLMFQAVARAFPLQTASCRINIWTFCQGVGTRLSFHRPAREGPSSGWKPCRCALLSSSRVRKTLTGRRDAIARRARRATPPEYQGLMSGSAEIFVCRLQHFIKCTARHCIGWQRRLRRLKNCSRSFRLNCRYRSKGGRR